LPAFNIAGIIYPSGHQGWAALLFIIPPCVSPTQTTSL